MDTLSVKKVLGAPIIASVLLWRTVVSLEDGFNPDEALSIEMARLLSLSVLQRECPAYKKALGGVVVGELISDPWDRLMSVRDIFDMAASNLSRADDVDILFVGSLIREHAIEGDPTTFSILKRGLRPLQSDAIKDCAEHCATLLNIPGEEIVQSALTLYREIFHSLDIQE